MRNLVTLSLLLLLPASALADLRPGTAISGTLIVNVEPPEGVIVELIGPDDQRHKGAAPMKLKPARIGTWTIRIHQHGKLLNTSKAEVEPYSEKTLNVQLTTAAAPPLNEGCPSDNAIHDVVKSRLHKLAACNARHRTSTAGRLVVRLYINEKGAVKTTSVLDDPLGNPDLTTCTITTLKAAAYPANQGTGGEPCIYQIPILFRPDQKPTLAKPVTRKEALSALRAALRERFEICWVRFTPTSKVNFKVTIQPAGRISDVVITPRHKDKINKNFAHCMEKAYKEAVLPAFKGEAFDRDFFIDPNE